MSWFYALNAGKADCLVLRLTSGKKVATVVVDGGTRRDPRNPLPCFLKELGVSQIDLMILTHIHQDHLGFLPEVSQTFPIREAVLPYPPIPLSAEQLDALYSQRQVANLRVYNALYHRLEETCRLYTAYPFTGPERYVFGAYTLTCLFPQPGRVSPVWSAYQGILEAPAEDAQAIADEGREAINGDSSLWLLEQGDEALLLLCGDGLDLHVAESCRRHGIRQVGMIKLSHHGRNDKGRVYFTPQTIGSLHPHTVVVSADETVAALHRSQFQSVAPKAKLLVTCEAGGFYKLPL